MYFRIVLLNNKLQTSKMNNSSVSLIVIVQTNYWRIISGYSWKLNHTSDIIDSFPFILFIWRTQFKAFHFWVITCLSRTNNFIKRRINDKKWLKVLSSWRRSMWIRFLAIVPKCTSMIRKTVVFIRFGMKWKFSNFEKFGCKKWRRRFSWFWSLF